MRESDKEETFAEKITDGPDTFVLEQTESGIFLMYDSFTVSYGAGDTPEEAIEDYLDCVAWERENGIWRKDS